MSDVDKKVTIMDRLADRVIILVPVLDRVEKAIELVTGNWLKTSSKTVSVQSDELVNP